MGAALTYARRYALFALVGLPARMISTRPMRWPARWGAQPQAALSAKAKPAMGVLNRAPVLGPPQSAELREQLVSQLASLTTSEDLLAWAMASLPRKNTLWSRTPEWSRPFIRPGWRTLHVLASSTKRPP
jgi:hypothetical protein